MYETYITFIGPCSLVFMLIFFLFCFLFDSIFFPLGVRFWFATRLRILNFLLTLCFFAVCSRCYHHCFEFVFMKRKSEMKNVSNVWTVEPNGQYTFVICEFGEKQRKKKSNWLESVRKWRRVGAKTERKRMIWEARA